MNEATPAVPAVLHNAVVDALLDAVSRREAVIAQQLETLANLQMRAEELEAQCRAQPPPESTAMIRPATEDGSS